MANLACHTKQVAVLLLLVVSLYSPATLALEGDIPFDPGTNERWILVDTSDYVLTVYTGNRPKAQFHNLAIGQNGTAQTRRRGDKTTPLGKFRVDYITDRSRYHLFISINYPTEEAASRALEDGTISAQEYQTYREQRRGSGGSPQRTALGGLIGIHGVGGGNIRLHRMANWTDGCVALENDQIEALSRMVEVGTRVYIR
ncbi:L,D-transpeptidase [Halorhodospira halochloris]|uniref:L,D-transpeptidase family protein n=1 Tax=Halorhodospira halochloris TaxID=1052 RepID=UPI001EE7FBC5|nr:L,D-transpeptidase [Halorhodospira halochloris]MCG5530482.1 L,D-transpeptidase [Halorhodospira halochloris]